MKMGTRKITKHCTFKTDIINNTVIAAVEAAAKVGGT